jgi:hypothetical protein
MKRKLHVLIQFEVCDRHRRPGQGHLHITAKKENALGQSLHVSHLLDRNPLEQSRQRGEPLIVEVEVEVHVLMNRLQFISHRFVQQLDASLLIHACLLNEHV